MAVKLVYWQGFDDPHVDGGCEVDNADGGPVTAIRIELEDGERLSVYAARLVNAGEAYMIECVETSFTGRRVERADAAPEADR